MGRSEADMDPVADEVLALRGTGRQVAPFSGRVPGFDLARAYRAAGVLRRARLAGGDRLAGRKIGFTNRTIWDEYDVHAPIWGDVYATSLHDLTDLPGSLPTFDLAGLAEPRIEPEIAFCLAAAPEAGMDDATLLDCIDWLAHGVEIVQSIYPGWRFTAADTVAAGGLHGALLLGPRMPVAPQRDTWLRQLPVFDIDLSCNGAVVDRGTARNVLDGPLSALRHLLALLAADPDQPPLAAGEVVTTGTLTRALPVAPGQAWHTALSGIDLPGLALRFR